MEPEALAFLKRVALSMLIALIWLAVNSVAAIKGDHAFIGERITFGNVIFYLWFIISVVLLVYIYKRMWEK